jgi:L-asparagine oxygenase
MTVDVSSRPANIYALDRKEREWLWQLSQCAVPVIADPRALAPHLDFLPEGLQHALFDFTAGTSQAGLLLVRGLETGDIPVTPTVPTNGAHGAMAEHPTGATLALIADFLGNLTGYSDEKNGALIHEVHPVAGEEHLMENSGSVTFGFHTENAHHPLSPDFLGLLCLRQDREMTAATFVASVREAAPLLDASMLSALREPLFQTVYPTSFTRGTGHRRAQSDPHPVLSGLAGSEHVRFDSHNTKAHTSRGARALDALNHALSEVRRDLILLPGDLAVINNRIAVHGRSAFAPRYDGRDRWLRRFYSLRSTTLPRGGKIDAPRVLPATDQLRESLLGTAPGSS